MFIFCIRFGAAALLLLIPFPQTSVAQIQFQSLDREIIERRLKDFSRDNQKRKDILQRLFRSSGCEADNLREQSVRKNLPPNLICTLPGRTDQVILVGAHFDHVQTGDGIVDNWSGAALLPTLLQSISGSPRHHTFLFVAFTGEEEGLLGSDFYVRKLTKEERGRISAMINLDSLGLGTTEVWATHADKALLNALATVANAMKSPLSAVNVVGGSSDAESFANFKIPRITLHSVSQETLAVLHSEKDKIDAIRWEDYYSTYRLLAGYLAFLDAYLVKTQKTPEEKH